jgi:hypothetical protein
MFQKQDNPLLAVLVFMFCAVVSLPLMAQKCNFEKNEIDALTELVVKRTPPELLVRIKGQPLYAKAQCIGTHKYLKLLFYKYNDFTFREQREVGFVLSNEEEVILYPRQMPADSTKMDQLVEANSLLIYKLNDDQYQNLLQYPIVKFKYYLVSGFVEVPVKSSKQGKVMDVLRCLE